MGPTALPSMKRVGRFSASTAQRKLEPSSRTATPFLTSAGFSLEASSTTGGTAARPAARERTRPGNRVLLVMFTTAYTRCAVRMLASFLYGLHVCSDRHRFAHRADL